MKRNILIVIIALGTFSSYCQFLPVHVHNKPIYDFLEEMAALKFIDVNTMVKPWSREFVFKQLKKLDDLRDKLNNRQKEELQYFLRDYEKDNYHRRIELQNKVEKESQLLGFDLNKKERWKQDNTFRWDLLYYQDSLFSIRINPILGYQFWFRDDGEIISHRWSMAEAEAVVGEHWSFYASYRDNLEEQILTKPEYFTTRFGAPYKRNSEYHETRGGIYYSWDWGNIGFAKDHFEWGTNVHSSNIFSARHPSIAHISLEIKPADWFQFNFVHGQLVSDVVDSIKSYFTTGGTYRTVTIPKYISANIFSAKPTNWLQFSVGNSVIYSDFNHWGYLIPLYFFKSVDHTLNSMYKTGQSGQNSQVFTEFVLIPAKGIRLNGTFYIDELSISRVTDPNLHNFISSKIGLMLIDFPLRNLHCFGEYTRTTPMTYQHNIGTTTFETNSFNLGHYLRDNSQEFFGMIRFRPTAHLRMELSGWLAQHGDDYIYGLEENCCSYPVLENISWQQKAIKFSMSYYLFHSGRMFAELLYQSTTGNVEKYTPDFFHGKHLYLSLGAHFGL
jgi:hypothetical protein